MAWSKIPSEDDAKDRSELHRGAQSMEASSGHSIDQQTRLKKGKSIIHTFKGITEMSLGESLKVSPVTALFCESEKTISVPINTPTASFTSTTQSGKKAKKTKMF